MELSKEQLAAVWHKDGPALVLAGPGSGKTTVITERIRYLIEKYHILSSKILVITFTKAAAKEMRERFYHLCPKGRNVCFGTFHSVFFMILKHAYGYRAEHIVQEEKKHQILKEILDSMSLELNDEQEFLSSIKSEISIVKNDRISLDYYHAVSCGDDEFRLFYRLYQERLIHLGLLDFDDMLVYCYELLKERLDICAIWQQKFPYILIDEFQDINKIQYDTIKLLAGTAANLFIVGDDDQSIYRFRGAKPEIMLNFEKDYPKAKRIVLSKNYRCNDKIVKAADRVIRNNQKRFPKDIQAVRIINQPVMLRLFTDLADENGYILEQIKKYQKQGVPYEEIAVLFRTNTQPRTLVSRLMEYNIPFTMRDIMPNIFEHWIAGNIITYIKLAVQLKEQGSMERGLFLRIMNRPLRYLSRDALENKVDFSSLEHYYQEKTWMLERIERLFYELKAISEMRPYAAITFIRKGIEYEQYLKEYAKEKKAEETELMEILDEIQESAKAYQTFDEWFLFIEEYSEKLKQQLMKKKQRQGISLSTMHSAKGLEFKVVFIIDVNEGIMPYHKAVLDADLEEERRLFYVAMTRAKDDLYICAVKERNHKEQELSRFIEEILRKGV